MHEGHHHHHSEEGFESLGQAVALMGYMLEHNKHHTEELHDVSHKLEAMGKTEAAKLLDKSIAAYFEGNSFLEQALKSVKEE